MSFYISLECSCSGLLFSLSPSIVTMNIKPTHAHVHVSILLYQPTDDPNESPCESSLPGQTQQESEVAETTTPSEPQRETTQTSPGKTVCVRYI